MSDNRKQKQSIEKREHWIFLLVPNIAFVAGIIMASIGGMMFLSSFMKLQLFDHDPYRTIMREECLYDFSHPLPYPDKEREVHTEMREKSEEEIQRCMEEKRREAREIFQNKKKQNLVDGFSALIVGLLLSFSFRRRK